MSGRHARAVAGLGVIAALLAACATGKNAVDPAARSGNRYVAGNGTTTILAAGHRSAAPKIAGTFLDGSKFHVDDLIGKVVVLNFWASWCPPCRVEAPDLESVSQQTKASGVRFIGVNVRDSRDSASAFQRTFKITYPSLYDQSDRVALQIKGAPPNSLPFTVVLDRQGRIAVVIRRSVRAAELLPIVRQVATEST